MKDFLLYGMALLYVAAGVKHFLKPRLYRSIMPPYLPFPMALVYLSGVCEIAFGLLLLPETTRPLAAWLIMGLLVAVFPANVQMMLNYRQRQHRYFWLTVARLPLQLVLIAWAWWYTQS